MEASSAWNLYDSILSSSLGSFIGVSSVIAGVGGLFYISYKILGAMGRAEPVDTMVLVKPFVISLCLIFFQTIILTPINFIFTSIDKGMISLLETDNSGGDYTDPLLEELERQTDNMTAESFIGGITASGRSLDANGNVVGYNKYESISEIAKKGGFYESGKFNPNAVLDSEPSFWDIKGWANYLFLSALSYLNMMIEYFIRYLQVFILLLLSLLGPFVFALGLFPHFGDVIKGWFTRYINISLWGVICTILNFFMNSLKNFIIDGGGMSIVSSSTNIEVVVLGIMGVLCFCTVPKIANMIISAGTSNPFGQLGTAIATTVGLWAGGAAGAVAGGATGIGGKAMTGISSRIGQSISKSLRSFKNNDESEG